ncbi:MAG: hypothetical protein QHI38_13685 [Armatimonadota bacterium]|nr:hypothetical protein [Armatimonadota bacterium]
MAITITAADVKRKAMITSSEYDSAISALIAEMQPALEYSIAPEHLSNTADANLQAVLKLGVLEIITGEFLEQLAREAGAAEEFSVAGLSIGESTRQGADLIQQGASRLAPFLRSVLPMMSESTTASNTADAETVFSIDQEVW